MCIDFLRDVRWKGQVTCAFCKHDKVYELKGVNRRFKCALCKRHFSVLKGTIFQNSPIPLQKWLFAIYAMVTRKKGISSCQLARDIEVTVKTAWFMTNRIRRMLRGDYETKLSGYVEIDETYSGGKNQNRHPNKKVKGSGGRSCKDKAPVIGIVSPEQWEYRTRPHQKDPSKTVLEKVVTKPAQLICKVTKDVRKETILPFIFKRVEKGAIIVTDEYSAYKDLQKSYDHQIVVHRCKQYVNDQGFTTNHIEGAWTHFKGMIIGTYRVISRKHLQKYVDEYCFRYNNRHLDKDRTTLFTNAFTHIERRLTWNMLVQKSTA